MKFLLVTATLLLSVTFAELISNEFSQTLTCYGSNGWKNSDGFGALEPEKEQCSSRCYHASVYNGNFLPDEENMIKLGCDINDYEETLLIPLMNHIQIAEELRGEVTILIDEQKLVVYNEVGKSTIEKIKSREKLALNGSVDLAIDEFELKLNFDGIIDLAKPFGSYSQSVKVCFGKPEICHNIILGSSTYLWLLAQLNFEKEVRILIDQLELKLSIKGDLTSVLGKIMLKEEFQANLLFQIFSNESYGWVHYRGKTSTSKVSTMIEDINFADRKYAILEYFYVQSDEISASIYADEKRFFASGCSENLCNY